MSRTVVSLMVLLALPAAADKLVVAPFSVGEGATEKAATQFRSLLEEELRKDGTLEVVLRPVTAKSTGKAAAVESSGALAEAKKAYDELRFEEAVPAYKRAVEAMLGDPATADFELISDAWVKLAASAFRMGEEREAKAALYELARLRPGFQLPAGFPPVFQKELEKAKKRVEKQPKATLAVDGPAGSTVYIDGRDLGMVPVSEEGLPAGVHSVKVEGGKGMRFGKQLELKPGANKVQAVFGAVPTGLVEPKIESQIDEASAARIAAYAKAAGADWALVGLLTRSSDAQLTLVPALYSVRRLGFVMPARVAFDVDVLTANTEAFRLAADVARLAGGPSPLASVPLAMAPKAAGQVSKAERMPADVEVVAPTRRVITPTELPTNATARMTPEAAEVVDQPVVKPGVPGWVWVVVAGVVVAGAGVGVGVSVSQANRPVTGHVVAVVE